MLDYTKFAHANWQKPKLQLTCLNYAEPVWLEHLTVLSSNNFPCHRRYSPPDKMTQHDCTQSLGVIFKVEKWLHHDQCEWCLSPIGSKSLFNCFISLNCNGKCWHITWPGLLGSGTSITGATMCAVQKYTPPIFILVWMRPPPFIIVSWWGQRSWGESSSAVLHFLNFLWRSLFSLHIISPHLQMIPHYSLRTRNHQSPA